MKFRSILSVCLAVMAFSACSNDDFKETENTNNKLNVVTSIDALTRAPQLDSNGSGSFTSGDKFTLLFTSTKSHQLVKTFDFTHGKEHHWIDVQIPSEVEQVKVSAVYPTATVSSNQAATAFKWNVMTSHDTNDLLVATPATTTVNSTSPIELTFSHVLHKLKVNLNGESQLTANATITCKNFKPEAVVNLLEGKATSASGQLQSKTVSGKTAEFIIPAQPVGTMELAFHVNNNDYSLNLGDFKVQGQKVTELKSGMTLELNVTITKNGFTVTGQHISAWGEQGSANGNIIL